MSSFDGIVVEFNGVSIDRFDKENLQNAVFLLSHCHTDHMIGLDVLYESLLKKNLNARIYMSHLSHLIIKNRFPNLSEFVVPLDIRVRNLIKVPRKDGPDMYMNVILVPAGHCPGSVMFILEDCTGLRVLYTGDFRISPCTLPKIKSLHDETGILKPIDVLYFDSTFWNEEYSFFPNRDDSYNAICKLITKWIRKGKKHIVSLSTPACYGTEFLLMEIYKQFKMPIHVSKDAYDVYSSIVDMDGTYTLDSSETQIHNCEFNNKKSLKCLQHDKDVKLRTIRISALSWKGLQEDSDAYKKDENEEKYYVCYSSHCSHNELKEFLEYLKPKSVIPCVVPSERSSQFNKSIQDFMIKVHKKSVYTEKKHSEIITKNINIHSESCHEVNIPIMQNNIYIPRTEVIVKNTKSRLSDVIKESENARSSFKLIKRIKFD